ncbi:MAG: DUF6516 family protein [Nitrospiria bacterium]
MPLFREKHVLPDGSIIEMVIWQLPRKTADRPHGIKYRLYYGSADGRCLVRYDNETGKGDHRHDKEREAPYPFVDVETLVSDFLADVTRARRFTS